MEELKKVFFSMSPTSAARLNWMNGYFFKKCLLIIKNDVLGVIIALFFGQMIRKNVSLSCIVLLPKVSNHNKIKEYRLISPSKIISKLVSNRHSSMLPNMISLNISCFVRGRNIFENVMLAQKIIDHIRKHIIGRNVITKFDMAKAYDRVS